MVGIAYGGCVVGIAYGGCAVGIAYDGCDQSLIPKSPGLNGSWLKWELWLPGQHGLIGSSPPAPGSAAKQDGRPVGWQPCCGCSGCRRAATGAIQQSRRG